MERVFRLLFQACEIKTMERKDQQEYTTDMTTAMDRENILYSAEHRGELRGEQRGIKIGEQRGIKIGEQQGIKKGEVQTVLRFMEKFGITPEQAAECTGLSVSELRSLLEKTHQE